MKWQKKEVRTSETSEATKRTRNQLARSPFLLPSLHPAAMHSLGNSEGASGPTGLARRKEFLSALSPSHGRFMVFAQETVARVRCQNERTCEQGKVRRRRRRPSAASTKSGQSPTDLPNPNFVPFRDPDERYRRRRDAKPNTSGVAAAFFLWEVERGLVRGRRRRRRFISWAA